MWQQHRIHNLIGQIQARSKDLAAIYEDTHGALKEELASLRGRDAVRPTHPPTHPPTLYSSSFNPPF